MVQNICKLYPEDEGDVNPVVAPNRTPSERSVLDEGEMVLRFKDGSIYRGAYDKQKLRPHGNGILKKTDGSTHDGEWVDGLPHGYGTAVYPNGDSYKGYFNKGKRDGPNGVYICKKYTYEGDWKDGAMEGKGEMKWNDGRHYSGEFKYNKFTGWGTYTYKSGAKFEGHYVDGYRHGRGKVTFPDNSTYQGDWKRDKEIGTATYTNPTGNSVIGTIRRSLLWK